MRFRMRHSGKRIAALERRLRGDGIVSHGGRGVEGRRVKGSEENVQGTTAGPAAGRNRRVAEILDLVGAQTMSGFTPRYHSGQCPKWM